MLTIPAPAKINLTLEVLSERSDDFHEIRSVAQTISLCDSLSFEPSGNVEFHCADTGWIPENSLVSKAISLLQKTMGCSQGVRVEVEKRIPLISGLSGDSSNAAAALCGLNKLWDLKLSLPKLAELASQLGSDATFFLYGGTALLEGRGEKVTPLPAFPKMSLVLMLPPVLRVQGKTGRLYANLPSSYYTNGEITERLVALLISGSPEGEGLASNVFNVLGEVACDNFDGLDRYREQFLMAGAKKVHLAGSGPTLFTLAEDKVEAEAILENLQREGLECYLAETLDVVGEG